MVKISAVVFLLSFSIFGAYNTECPPYVARAWAYWTFSSWVKPQWTVELPARPQPFRTNGLVPGAFPAAKLLEYRMLQHPAINQDLGALSYTYLAMQMGIAEGIFYRTGELLAMPDPLLWTVEDLRQREAAILPTSVWDLGTTFGDDYFALYLKHGRGNKRQTNPQWFISERRMVIEHWAQRVTSKPNDFALGDARITPRQLFLQLSEGAFEKHLRRRASGEERPDTFDRLSDKSAEIVHALQTLHLPVPVAFNIDLAYHRSKRPRVSFRNAIVAPDPSDLPYLKPGTGVITAIALDSKQNPIAYRVQTAQGELTYYADYLDHYALELIIPHTAP